MPEVVDVQQEAVAIPPRRFELPQEEPEQPKTVEPAATPTGENTGEQAPPATPEAKPDTEKDDPEKRGTRRFERRIQKAYQKMAEEKARADFLQKQLDEQKQRSSTVATSDPSAPTLEQHGFDPEKYAEAKAAYEADKRLKEYQSKQQEETKKQAIERVSTEWEDKVAKVEEKYEDFEEKVGKLNPQNPVVLAIMESDLGPDIAYYLGSHTDEAKKIFSLSPASAIREIGKLEAKLSTPAEKPKAASKAPAPITPLTGTSPVASNVPSDDDDTGDWIRKRQRQVHRR